jgi:DNA-binding Xre family transcriptional regulator
MKVKLRNRLEVLMKDAGISTFEEMAQRLTENQGFKITRTPLSRKFRDADVALSLSMIEAICNELQCLPGDLFETDVSEVSEQFVEGLRARLQPFRYGSIRLGKTGSEGAAQGDETIEPESSARKAHTRGGRTASVDDVAGPRVSHLSAERIKRKK